MACGGQSVGMAEAVMELDNNSNNNNNSNMSDLEHQSVSGMDTEGSWRTGAEAETAPHKPESEDHFIGKTFQPRPRAKERVLLHTHFKRLEGEYICLLCGKRCRSHNSFTIHALIFHFIRGVKCFKCGRTFTQKDSPRHHGDARRGSMYECAVCRRKFDQYYAFLRHKETHESDDMKYECLECALDFGKKCNLSQ